MSQYKKNQTASPLIFLMVSDVDHISPVLGATPIVTISKNGASFAVIVGAVQEIGLGWYKVVPNIADFDTLGPLALHAMAVGADPTDAQHDVVSGTVELAGSQIVDIIGNVSGSVGSVLNPVTCKSKCRKCGC